MYIKSTLVSDFGNFELDTSAIGMNSLSFTDVRLPYAGPLPSQISSVSSAYIYFNVQATEEPSIILGTRIDGVKKTYILVADKDELIYLLDKFFSQESGYCMDDFYFGQWRGLYMTWRKVVTLPRCLMPLILSFSERDKNYIKDHIFERI